MSRVDQVSTPGALRRLASNGRHPRDWPGAPLAIAGLDRKAGSALADKPLGTHLMVAASLPEARSMLLRTGVPSSR